MIILIGGSSHTGKTFLAQKLMEKLNIPYISLDHIKMMFIRSGLTELTVEDDYEMRYFLWPYVAELIKTAVENDQNLIIEGCYIPSEWKEYFEEGYLKNIRCFFITMSEEYLKDNIDKVRDFGCVIEHRLDDEVDLERLINCSREFREEAKEHGIPLIDIIESYDIDWMIGQALSIIGE